MNCKDCYHCKAKIFQDHKTGNIMRASINRGKATIRCTKGHWTLENGNEKTYIDLNQFLTLKGSRIHPIACPDYVR